MTNKARFVPSTNDGPLAGLSSSNWPLAWSETNSEPAARGPGLLRRIPCTVSGAARKGFHTFSSHENGTKKTRARVGERCQLGWSRILTNQVSTAASCATERKQSNSMRPLCGSNKFSRPTEVVRRRSADFARVERPSAVDATLRSGSNTPRRCCATPAMNELSADAAKRGSCTLSTARVTFALACGCR